MKGRTLSDQNKMKVGGVTKMQTGGSLKERIASIRSNVAANQEKRLSRLAAKNAGKPLTNQPLSTGVKTTSPQAKAGFSNLANRMRANMPAQTPATPKYQAPVPESGFSPMPLPPVGGMRKGGATKRKMSKKY